SCGSSPPRPITAECSRCCATSKTAADAGWSGASHLPTRGTVGEQPSGGGAVTELMGIARFRIHEGKLDEYERLSAEAMEIVRTKEPGTLQYDTYFNEARIECVVIERYR